MSEGSAKAQDGWSDGARLSGFVLTRQPPAGKVERGNVWLQRPSLTTAENQLPRAARRKARPVSTRACPMSSIHAMLMSVLGQKNTGEKREGRRANSSRKNLPTGGNGIGPIGPIGSYAVGDDGDGNPLRHLWSCWSGTGARS
jgi:hypothetical protein